MEQRGGEMTDKEKTAECIKRLYSYFGSSRDWAFETELRAGTGYHKGMTSRFDAFAISTRYGNSTIGFPSLIHL